MKKKLLFAAVLALVSCPSFAVWPKVDFGIRAGINTTNFDLNRIRFGDNYWLINESHTGFHAGALMRVNLTTFFVQPEFNYNWNSYDMNILSRAAGGDQSVTKVRVQTLEVPVLAGIRLLFLRGYAGPVFNVMTDTSMGSGGTANVSIQKPSMSYAIGLGLDALSLSLDVRYNGQFEKTRQNIMIGGDDPLNFRSNFRGWTFSIGYNF